MKQLIIWHKPKDDSYYYRIVNGTYSQYRVGFKNQYEHVIVLVIDDIWYREPQKKSIKKKVLTSSISFLQNKLNKIER